MIGKISTHEGYETMPANGGSCYREHRITALVARLTRLHVNNDPPRCNLINTNMFGTPEKMQCISTRCVYTVCNHMFRE